MGWVGSEPRPEDLGIWQMQEGRIFQKEGTALEGMNSWLGFMVNGVRETLRGWCLGFEARRLGGGEDGGAVKPGGRRLRRGGSGLHPELNRPALEGGTETEPRLAFRITGGRVEGRLGGTRWQKGTHETWRERPGSGGGAEAGDGAEEEFGGPRGAGHARGSSAGSCVCVWIPTLLRT